MKEEQEVDYTLYFDSKAWQLNPQQIHEIVKKFKLKENLLQMPMKNKKDKIQKI